LLNQGSGVTTSGFCWSESSCVTARQALVCKPFFTFAVRESRYSGCARSSARLGSRTVRITILERQAHWGGCWQEQWRHVARSPLICARLAAVRWPLVLRCDDSALSAGHCARVLGAIPSSASGRADQFELLCVREFCLSRTGERDCHIRVFARVPPSKNPRLVAS
jgi:hypothetical protein